MSTSRRKKHNYLLSDGTLIEIFEERRGRTIIGETADITYGYCKVSLRPEYRQKRYGEPETHGRIITHDHGFIKLAKGGKISAHLADVAAGSENSRARGLAVQGVTLTTKSGIELSWYDIPSLIGSHFHIQIGSSAQYGLSRKYSRGDDLWSGSRVWNVKDLRPKPLPEPPSETLGDNDGRCAPGF